MRLEFLKVDKLQRRDMACFENNLWRAARLESFLPTFDAKAPAVAVFETWKFVFGPRSGQVVSSRLGKMEELVCHNCANGVQS